MAKGGKEIHITKLNVKVAHLDIITIMKTVTAVNVIPGRIVVEVVGCSAHHVTQGHMHTIMGTLIVRRVVLVLTAVILELPGALLVHQGPILHLVAPDHAAPASLGAMRVDLGICGVHCVALDSLAVVQEHQCVQPVHLERIPHTVAQHPAATAPLVAMRVERII